MKVSRIFLSIPLSLALFACVSAFGTGARSQASQPDTEPTIEGSLNVRSVPSRDYSQIAKVTMAEASKVAQTSVKGHVAAVALENEDGSLVYSVEILDAAGARHEVLVDAGNGKVLRKERKMASTSNGRDDDDDESGDDAD